MTRKGVRVTVVREHIEPATTPAGGVSVIIPAYNVAGFLAETLDSVFAQTVTPHQVIVINDGSPDTIALEAVLAPYRERIVYLVQQNQGLSGARNTGIAAATGEFLALLDGDDVWLPEYLERQLLFLQRNPGYDLVYCDAIFFGRSAYTGKRYMEVCPSAGEATAAALIARRCHVFVSVLARAEALRGVPFDRSLRSCEDFDCWLRLTAAGGRIGYQREVLVRYRKHDASLSANLTRMMEINLEVLRKARSLWAPGTEEHRLLLAASASKAAELATMRGKLALGRGEIALAAEQLQLGNRFYRSWKLTAALALLRNAPWLVRAALRLRGLLLPAYREPAAL